MEMFETIKQKLAERRRKRALRSIRETMAYFGHDTTFVSDDELEAKLVEFQERLKVMLPKVCVSAHQAAAAFQRLGMVAAIGPTRNQRCHLSTHL